MLDPLRTAREIAEDYRRYLATTFGPRTPRLGQQFAEALSRGIALAKGPYLQASPPFVEGRSVHDLVREGVLSDGFLRLPKVSFPIARSLYVHQEQAIRKAVRGGRNLVVATGTGSGKTECFLVPIVNYLLREGAEGTLARPGVRALLLYPMNALANDQLKRLRRLLGSLPEITFGRYVGETRMDPDEAEEDFRARYPFEPRVQNEILSRKQMQEKPPHLLLTNYAMLEYLLLRPEDSPLFDGSTGAHWRFIVLDEAHVYAGAEGTEIGMLLRRLRDRINGSKRGLLQCFATSATLGRGEADFPELVSFAQALFDEPFEWTVGDPARQDVVGATRRSLASRTARYRLPQESYSRLFRAFVAGAEPRELEAIARQLHRDVPTLAPGATAEQYLAGLLAVDERVIELQALLERGSVETEEVARRVFGSSDTQPDVVALIGLAVTAKPHPEDAPLIPARYHLLLRALEGAFVCLHPDHPPREPVLLLARHERCPACAKAGRRAAMFELSTCKRCGAEYLSGSLEGRRLVSSSKPGQLKHLLLGEATEVDDEDEAALAVEGDGGSVTRKLICPACGLALDDLASPCDCENGPTRRRVTVAEPAKGTGVLHRCVACSGRTNGEIVTRFLTGTDAPVAVISTTLYQQLPPSRDPELAQEIGQGRKLLTFSDSRQDAAFFAPYLERTYRRAVQRRLILAAAESLREERPRTEDLIVPIRREAERCLVLDPDASALTNVASVRSWLMEEILAVDRRQSLEGTGTLEIAVALPRKFRVPVGLTSLGLDDGEAEDLIRMLLETLRVGVALTFPEGVDVRDETFAPRNREVGCRAEGTTSGVLAWLPGRGSNRRLDVVDKVLARKGVNVDARAILKGSWDYFTNPTNGWDVVLVPYGDRQHGALWRLSHERFEFLLASENHRPMQCDTCRQIWWRTVAGVCPSYRCAGTVSPVEDLSGLAAGHYASLYRRLRPIGISVEEHTAQWTASEASRIQDQFVRGNVNVLSCSTTFELGVDVGEVEAVLLRNVPPTPANYVQRAGRAGRRKDAAALAVTFAQRRSHDLAQFEDPRRMIDGVIRPPRIYLDNYPIARRHAHSVAFAAFERLYGGHRTVAEFFTPPTQGGQAASEAFIGWLRSRPQAVQDALSRVLTPTVAQHLGIRDWSWVESLVRSSPEEPTQGWFARAEEEVRGDVAELDELIKRAVDNREFEAASKLDRQRRTLSERNLLGFLASRNVLPKYGFPVDVVPLDLSRSGDRDASKLELDRDLKLAISEYAPGAEVVAAKSLWRSLGLVTRPGRAWPTRRWAACGECGAFRHGIGEVTERCPACGSHALAPGRAGTFVIPIFGFTGARSPTAPGETRPPRMATTETFFGEYQPGDSTQLEIVPELSAGGRVVHRRFSRQGRITLVNRGPAGRGFRICERCGYADSAPDASALKNRAAKASHRDIRRPSGQCGGTLTFRHLGHEYLTDVLELRLDMPQDSAVARSVLYALLAGVEALSIRRDDMDGTLHRFALGIPPALILFDAVPGGAGHAQRVGHDLPAVFEASYKRVTACECGEETSCYNCLRSYGNQLWHEELSRGKAAQVLKTYVRGSP